MQASNFVLFCLFLHAVDAKALALQREPGKIVDKARFATHVNVIESCE